MEPGQNEYLLLSRGKWDKNVSPDEIERTIQKFYDWIEGHVVAGKMRHGSRLSTRRAVVSKSGVVIDGPFGESKEIIGGYWFIVARSLREAAELAADNPCAQIGLSYEIRPLEPARASAYKPANETPE